MIIGEGRGWTEGAVSRAAIPTELVVPGRVGVTRVLVGLVIEADPVRVVAPGLADMKNVLAPGGVEMVERYCAIWTGWLARATAPKKAGATS